MATKISASELREKLPSVLSRVHDGGETFEIEQEGEVLASIRPVRSVPRGNLRELIEVLKRHPVDPEFADDLERIQREQPKAEFPEWPS